MDRHKKIYDRPKSNLKAPVKRSLTVPSRTQLTADQNKPQVVVEQPVSQVNEPTTKVKPPKRIHTNDVPRVTFDENFFDDGKSKKQATPKNNVAMPVAQQPMMPPQPYVPVPAMIARPPQYAQPPMLSPMQRPNVPQMAMPAMMPAQPQPMVPQAMTQPQMSPMPLPPRPANQNLPIAQAPIQQPQPRPQNHHQIQAHAQAHAQPQSPKKSKPQQTARPIHAAMQAAATTGATMPLPTRVAQAPASPYGELTVSLPMMSAPKPTKLGQKVKHHVRKATNHPAVKPYSDSVKRGVNKIKQKSSNHLQKVKPSDAIRYGVVAFFIAISTYLAYDTWRTNQQVQNVFQPEASAVAPIETPAVVEGEAFPDYKVAADMPRVLRVPKIGVTARILEVGLNGANKIDVPSNDNDSGWYKDSAKPGEKGAAFVTGHYNAGAGGVFDNLAQLALGDNIEIEMGDGKRLSYEVVEHQTLDVYAINMEKALEPFDGVDEGLNIMTCAGQFTSIGFNQRTLIYTKRISN